MLPNKRSNKWITIFTIYALIVFFSFIATRLILNSALSGQLIFRFALLALGSASLPAGLGYWGRTTFFKIYTLGNLLGLFYMFYIVLANVSPGWGDLTSIAGYIVTVFIGLSVATIFELIQLLSKNRKKSS